MVAGVISPVWALILLGALAIAAPKPGKAGLHAIVFAVWIVTFLLASNYVTNDWVIWTPMHLYIVHLAVLPIILFGDLQGGIEGTTITTARTLLLGFLSVLLSVPTATFVTFLMILPWDYFGKATGIHTMDKQGPALWCFVLTWGILQSALLIAWIIHRRRRAGRNVQ